MSIALGIGIWMGPSIGSLFYSLTDYSTSFLIMGFIIVISTFVLQIILPKSLNRDEDEKTQEETN